MPGAAGPGIGHGGDVRGPHRRVSGERRTRRHRADWTTGANPKLTIVDPETGERVGNHEYISAVAILRHEDLAFKQWSHRWKDERRDLGSGDPRDHALAFLEQAAGDDVPHCDDVYLDVFHTISDQAIPLPRDAFGGPHDRHWVPDDTRTALVPRRSDV